jgi:hypothetical protein
MDKPKSLVKTPKINKKYGIFNQLNCPDPVHRYWCPTKTSWCVKQPEHCLSTKNDLEVKQCSLIHTTKKSKYYRPKKIVAKVDENGKVVQFIEYPSLSLPWKEFMSKIESQLKPHLIPSSQESDKCATFNPAGGPVLTYPQQIASLYLRPTSPYKGLELWHTVGVGKTITGFSILKNFRDNFSLWWITSVRLRTEMANRPFDFKAFDPEMNVKILKTSNSPITFRSYEQLRNILQGKNEWARKVVWKDNLEHVYKQDKNTKKWASTSLIDPLRKTIICVDEAHKMFEEPDIELIEQAIWDSYEKSGDDSVRLVLMTATPVPGMEKTQSELEKELTPYVALRSINLLIPDISKRFPLNEEGFAKRYMVTNADGEVVFNAKLFREHAKGLVSYYNHYETPETGGVFASPIYEEIQTVDSTPKINTKLTHCTKSKPNDNEKRNICYWKASTWAGPNIFAPKSWRMNTYDIDAVKESMNEVAPKAVALVNHIQKLDEADLKKYGRKFKHVIFSNLNPATGAVVIAAVMRSKSFNYINNTHSHLKEIGYHIANGKVELLEGHRIHTQSKDDFLYFEKGATQRETKPMFEMYNSHKYNSYGQLARIALLDNKYKEGIDIFDARYLHIVEPQMTDTEFVQVVGRVVRRCGHTGLPVEDRNVKIFVYDVKISPEQIKTNKKILPDVNYIELGDHIVYNRSSQKAEEAKKLILDHLKYAAVDRPFIFTKQIKQGPKNIKQAILGYLSEPVPRKLLPKNANLFSRTYPKINRLTLIKDDLKLYSNFKSLDDMVLDAYLMQFFADTTDVATLREITPVDTWLNRQRDWFFGKPYEKEVPKPIEDLLDDFNYHKDILFNFKNKLYVPVFEWQKRSEINYNSMPDIKDIRVLLVLHKSTNELTVYIRNLEGKVKIIYKDQFEKNKIKNLTNWLKVPDFKLE